MRKKELYVDIKKGWISVNNIWIIIEKENFIES